MSVKKNRWHQWRRKEGRREGKSEKRRQANKMGFIDEGRHGGEEKRETSKGFDVTAFQTDNSSSASRRVHAGDHIHMNARKVKA